MRAFGALSLGAGGQNLLELPLEWTNSAGPGQGVPPGMPQPPSNPNPNPNVPNPGLGGQGGRPLAIKLWAVPEFKERYRQIYQQLAAKFFLAEPTIACMAALQKLIRPQLESVVGDASALKGGRN